MAAKFLSPYCYSYGRKLRFKHERCLLKCGQRKRCEYAQEQVDLAQGEAHIPLVPCRRFHRVYRITS